METQNLPSTPEQDSRPGFMQRNALSIKIIFIGVLILLLFIPIAMVRSLITERLETAQQATHEVRNKWSGGQEIAGPYLNIPFYENKEGIYYQEGNKVKITKTLNYLHVLPENLEISGHIETENLNRGIYEIVVYRTTLELKGKFILPKDFSKEIPLENLLLQNATLNMGITDLRGISEQIKVQWDDQMLQFNSGLPDNDIIKSGVSTPIELDSLLINEHPVHFSIRLYIKGSQSIRFAPFGETTQVNITSNGITPSFTGSFLPEEREINKDGFTAHWKVLNLNRNYPQVFIGNRQYKYDDFSYFGVDLLIPVQQYQQSMRSVKYAFLIIILTFVVSFFTEVIQKKDIHPFQYLLTGLALCLFYTLLIAFSEHIGFTPAYFISSLMTASLLTLYMLGVLHIRKTAFIIGGLLILLYLYIFVLIQMETYALLAGSIGLFIILAIIMYYSQKINWYNPGNLKHKP